MQKRVRSPRPCLVPGQDTRKTREADFFFFSLSAPRPCPPPAPTPTGADSASLPRFPMLHLPASWCQLVLNLTTSSGGRKNAVELVWGGAQALGVLQSSLGRLQSTSSIGISQWLRLHTAKAGGLGSIPGQGTRSHTAQVKKKKISRGAMETWCSQIN